MFEQYFFQNIDFAVSIFGFLVFLSMSYLHLDAWFLDRKGSANMFTKGIGFLCISIFYAFEATRVSTEFLYQLSNFSLMFGLMLVFFGLLAEKILEKPKVTPSAPILAMFTSVMSVIHGVVILIHGAIAIQYLLKATKGLHKELKSMFFGFVFLTIAQILTFTYQLSESSNVYISTLFSEFGLIWIIAHIIQVIGLLVVSSWVFGYIRFRLNVQMFILAITTSFTIFVITTFVFTFLLLRNLEGTALGHLDTDSKIFQFSVERFETEALSFATSSSKDGEILQALDDKDVDALFDRATDLMIGLDSDFFVVTDDDGTVIVRAEDQKNVGNSLSDDSVVSSAINGEARASLSGTDDPFATRIQVKAASPIVVDDEVIGTVLTGFVIDDAFVDSVKSVTGLDVTLYSEDQKAATTLVSADGKSRLIGAKETNEEITSTVLEEAETYSGTELVLDQPYYVTYKPLKSLDDNVIGMLFVGKPQSDLVATAEESFRLTFIGSIILMVISLGPSYLISKFIADNVQA